jgi:short-subunit dehydrogenase
VEEVRGRNALLTGAGGGLGEYIARALAAQGVNLALTDLPEAPVDGLAAELRSRDVTVEHAPSDLTDPDDRRRLISWAEETLGPIDILVNNAGLEFGGAFLRMSAEELEAIVTVNLIAVMDLTRIALPGMLDRGRGHVVNIASLAGKMPAPALCAYSATKHGVVGFTHSLRAEYGFEPVGFSAICPTYISRVGMYGRLEHALEGDSNPVGTLPPERVGEAVVRAVRRNAAEIVLTGRPVRPFIFMHAMLPRTATRLARARPLREFSERFARARGRP